MPPRLSSIPCSSSLALSQPPPSAHPLSRRMRNRPRRRGSGSLSAPAARPLPPPPTTTSQKARVTYWSQCAALSRTRGRAFMVRRDWNACFMGLVWQPKGSRSPGFYSHSAWVLLARGISRPGIPVTLIKTERWFSRRKAQFGRVLRAFPKQQPPLFTVTASSAVLLSWFHD